MDESSGVGDGQVLRSVVAVVHQPLQVRAPAFLARLDRVFQGAARVVGVHARAGGPADDPAGEQVHDERRVAEPRPGRHVGEVDHPSAVRAGGGEVAAQQVAGDPVPLGGPGGAGLSAGGGPRQPQRPHAPLHGAPGHPGALLPGVEQPPGLPGSQRRVERLGPQGEDPLVQGGVRERAGRWGPAAGGVVGGRGDPAP